MIQLWKCLECGRINYSIVERIHEMNICKCDKTGVDIDPYLCRTMGNVEFLENLDYNFFDEIIMCMQAQDIGFNYIVFECFPFGQVTRIDFNEIRNIEDEICKDLVFDLNYNIQDELLACCIEQGHSFDLGNDRYYMNLLVFQQIQQIKEEIKNEAISNNTKD